MAEFLLTVVLAIARLPTLMMPPPNVAEFRLNVEFVIDTVLPGAEPL
jgi:hypothetical protein